MDGSIFVSYAHASPEHQAWVRELVEALRRAHLVVIFDGDIGTPQGPPEGWPLWSEKQVKAARWVLVVCEETYKKRYDGQEPPGVGRGATWEAAIVRQELHDQGSVNSRFIPVLLEGARAEHIPTPLRGATYYRCPAQLADLAAALSGGAATGVQAIRQPSTGAAPVPARAAGTETNGSRERGPATERVAQAAWLAAGSFAAAVLLVTLWLWQGRRLAERGESAAFYYLVLVVLGAAVGAFLFGALRSLGRYRGRVPGGRLELGGPAVAALLVIWGGVRFVPPASDNFSLAVYVHDARGPQAPLAGAGSIFVDLRGDRRSEPVGEKGQAYFAEIPASFRGQRATLWLESDEYELIDPGALHPLDAGSVYLRAQRKAARVRGRVQDGQGHTVVGASVHLGGITAQTDGNGRFEVTVPSARVSDGLVLEIQAEGFAPWRGSVVPNSNDVGVVLTKER